MAHGMPDYGIYAPKLTVFGLEDMAELAARLGSIVTFDRRGDVVWMDDFEDNIAKWAILGSGTGYGAALSTEAARNGAKSVKLTTGAAIGNGVSILREIPPPVLGKCGLEISWTAYGNLAYVLLIMTHFDGAKARQGQVRYRRPQNDLQYLDSTNTFQTFATPGDIRDNIVNFHTAKLVIDLKNDKYTRFILDAVTYDLSAYALRTGAAVTSPNLTYGVETETRAAENTSNYVDDCIVTQNEP